MLKLQCRNIHLREFAETDIENKVHWINDEKNNRYLHYDLPLSIEKTKNWFQNKAENRLDCVIEYQGIAVGLIGLLNIDKQNQKAEFYISMGRDDFKRKGIATLSTKLLLSYAFEDLKLNKIYLNVDEENIAACNLYEKIGFTLEGRFIQDMFHRGKLINRLRYAILREEWV
ncbi:MAG: GNAT family N-acetyltransferase [Clostridia bacterium]|nr:GNAT family N-acetyltransferase [Clostridia bacterium]